MAHTSPPPVTRRDALCRIGSGFGMMAFANLVSRTTLAAEAAQKSKAVVASGGLHHPAKARAVIFLFMNGGLSQVDSFDPKPMLEKYHGQPLPGGSVATERKTGSLMKSPFTFARYGKSGLEVSELFPHVGASADDICVIRSMHTDIPNHEPSMLMMNTGHIQVGRPSMGSWLTYGLGTENKNLPGYVVLCPDIPTTVGPPLWNSAFLPAVHQGTYIADKVERPDQIVGKDFDPKKLDIFKVAAEFKADSEDDRRKLLFLVAAVHEADEEIDFAEDDYLRSLCKALDLPETALAGMVVDVEVEELQQTLATVRKQPPPPPKRNNASVDVDVD